MRDSCTCRGTVTRSGTQDTLVIGGHVRAAEGDGCHAVTCGLVETLAVTPHGPRHVIMGGGDQEARPHGPFAEEAQKAAQDRGESSV